MKIKNNKGFVGVDTSIAIIILLIFIPTITAMIYNINKENKNDPVIINDINKTIIYSGDNKETVIQNGYLDIGINDTMKDLIVNFIGAIVFSVLGFLYIKDRDEYKFIEIFLPVMK